MRIVFAGTPAFAAEHFSYLLEQLSIISDDAVVVAAYTQPDRRAGRGKKLLHSPVKTIALEQGIPVYQPLSLKDAEAQKTLADMQADLMVVVAYGMLLPKQILDTPRLGCINVHASLLPRWRGAAPVERCLIAGDDQSGVTIMQMDEGLDTGDMLLKATCTIDEYETGDSLRAKLIACGKPLLVESLQQLAAGMICREKQVDDLSCYAPKLQKTEGQIDWQESAEQITRKVRAFTSSLASFTVFKGERIRITEAQALTNQTLQRALPGEILSCGVDGIAVRCGSQSADQINEPGHSALVIRELQLPGKRAMSVRDVLNGKADLFQVGEQFSQPNIENTVC